MEETFLIRKFSSLNSVFKANILNGGTITDGVTNVNFYVTNSTFIQFYKSKAE